VVIKQEESAMTSLFQRSLVPLTALDLLLASPAMAQTAAPDPHHPADAPAAPHPLRQAR